MPARLARCVCQARGSASANVGEGRALPGIVEHLLGPAGRALLLLGGRVAPRSAPVRAGPGCARSRQRAFRLRLRTAHGLIRSRQRRRSATDPPARPASVERQRAPSSVGVTAASRIELGWGIGKCLRCRAEARPAAPDSVGSSSMLAPVIGGNADVVIGEAPAAWFAHGGEFELRGGVQLLGCGRLIAHGHPQARLRGKRGPAVGQRAQSVSELFDRAACGSLSGRARIARATIPTRSSGRGRAKIRTVRRSRQAALGPFRRHEAESPDRGIRAAAHAGGREAVQAARAHRWRHTAERTLYSTTLMACLRTHKPLEAQSAPL